MREDGEAARLHLRALTIRQSVFGPDSPEAAASLTRIAALLVQRAEFKKAEPLLNSALAIIEMKLGRDAIEAANTLDVLSWLYQLTGRMDDAEAASARGVQIARTRLGADDPDLATKLSNYGTLKRERGALPDARDLTAKALAIREKALRPDHPDLAESLHNLALIDSSMGHREGVEARYKRAISIWRASYGPAHPLVETGLTNLATFYMEQGRFPEAEPIYRESLTKTEARAGPNHQDAGNANNNLGLLYIDMGRYREAEPHLLKALAIDEASFGKESAPVARVLNNLGNLDKARGEYAEAAAFYERALAIKEKIFGAFSPDVATTLQNLAITYYRNVQTGKAEAAYRRAAAIIEAALGAGHPALATVLQNLGALYEGEGRYGEAEAASKRSLEIREKTFGLDHPDVAESPNNLAKVKLSLGLYDEMAALDARAIAIWTKAFGPEHPQVGRGLNNLAASLLVKGRREDAEKMFRKALEVRLKALGPNHAEVAETLNSLGGVIGNLGRYAEAKLYLQQALEIREAKLPPDHPDLAISLSALGDLLALEGHLQDAETLDMRALEIRERSLGTDHPVTAMTRNSLALIKLRQGHVSDGLAEARRSTAALIAHQKLEIARGGVIDVENAGVLDRRTLDFRVHLLALEQAIASEPAGRDQLVSESFVTGQWALRNAAGKAVSQTALRAAAGSPALAHAVRERQDAAAAWQILDRDLTSRLSATAQKRDPGAEAKSTVKKAGLAARVAELDTEIAARFPGFAVLLDAAPVSVSEVQRRLGPDEAVIQFLVTDEKTHAWLITRTKADWYPLPVRGSEVKENVLALRCGLDETAWDLDRDGCNRVLKTAVPAGTMKTSTLRFDTKSAYNLFRMLFAPFAFDLVGKRLIIVPSGALLQLPPEVLVTEDPSIGRTGPSWLGVTNAITILPSAANLGALEAGAHEKSPDKPYLGVGNPLLTGQDGLDRSAFSVGPCKSNAPATLATSIASPHSPDFRGLAGRSSQDLVELLRRQPPLPETAAELCAVANLLGAEPEDVKLGGTATVAAMADLSNAGTLAHYAIVHFATHGLKAGDLPQMQEPALLLTPPSAATTADTGLLTASDVARLKMNADWVILSACNTAAGGGGSTEAFSGLARAFFYAGSRALLVSHWPVNSEAAVRITTGVFKELSRAPDISRAEALRRVLADLASSSNPSESRPSYWAPFVLVGAQ